MPSSADLRPWTSGCSTRCPGRAARCRASAPTRCWPRWSPPAARSARNGWSTRSGDRTTYRPTRPRRSRSWSREPARRPRPEVVARTDHGYRLGLPADAVDALVLRDAVVGAREAEGRHDLVRARDLARVALALPAPGSAADGPLGELRLTAARHRAIAAACSAGPSRGWATTTRRCRCSRRADADDEAIGRGAAALDRGGARRAGRAGALRAAPRGPRRPARRRPRPGAPGAARRAAGRRPTGARGAAVRGVLADRSRRATSRALRPRRSASRGSPRSSGRAGWARPGWRTCSAAWPTQPVVHFVELVGVTSPEGVVGEVGDALGVRDSVSGRRVLTPAQRTDLRGRIVADPHQAPTLLILDNCEHVVEAVADLVACCSSPARRPPGASPPPARRSAIAAERVYPLRQLGPTTPPRDLFVQRASAARPGVRARRRRGAPRRPPARRAARWPSSWRRPRCG